MISLAIRMVVSGVRSSCDTSETNRRCMADSSSMRRIWSWRLSAISLKERARLAISSVPRAPGMRSDRWPSARRSATVAARVTGVTVCRAMVQVTTPSSASIPNPPASSTRCTNDSVSCSGCREYR